VFDRCNLCHGPLRFYGISVRPFWTKWMECQFDAAFFGADEFGTLVLQTKRIPDTAYFVKTVDKRD
jgi:hypothetical protein